MARKLVISFALTSALTRRLTKLAKVRRVSRSVLAQQMLEDQLEHVEAAAKVLGDPVLMGMFGKVMSEPGVARSLMEAFRADASDEQLRLFEETLRAVARGKVQKEQRS
jgi:hypothetical protein